MVYLPHPASLRARQAARHAVDSRRERVGLRRYRVGLVFPIGAHGGWEPLPSQYDNEAVMAALPRVAHTSKHPSRWLPKGTLSHGRPPAAAGRHRRWGLLRCCLHFYERFDSFSSDISTDKPRDNRSIRGRSRRLRIVRP